MKIIIYTDGGARGNPGPGASAYVIKEDGGQLLIKDGIFLGVATNNEAEYQAVIEAFNRVLEDFKNNLPVEVEVRADSKLVVEQLSGNFKVKNPRIKVLFDKVQSLEREIGKVNYTYIPRAQNYLADELVNQILDNNL